MTCRLRKITEADLEQVRLWRMLPDITRYMYTEPQISPEQQRAWFERISRSDRDLVWIVELTDGNLPVGVLSLNDIDRVHSRCAWAYYLGSDQARGKSLGKLLECNIYDHVFLTMGLNRLWCEVLAFNDRVVKLHETFGSKVEGILRSHIIKHGEAHDVVRMAILRAEWLERREQLAYSSIDIEWTAA